MSKLIEFLPFKDNQIVIGLGRLLNVGGGGWIGFSVEDCVHFQLSFAER